MVRALVKAPVPEPSTVFESEIVGEPVVFQQTPRAVTAAPPSALIVPPETAECAMMEEAGVVERVGGDAPNKRTVAKRSITPLLECPATTILPSDCRATPSPILLVEPMGIVTFPVPLKVVSSAPALVRRTTAKS